MDKQTYLHSEWVRQPTMQSVPVHRYHHRGYTDQGQKIHNKLIAAQLQSLHQRSPPNMPPTPRPTPSPASQRAQPLSMASHTPLRAQRSASQASTLRASAQPFEHFTLADLHNHLARMSIYHIHYTTLYLAFGRIYHTLPFSVRADRSLSYTQQIIASEACTAMPFRELPQLVQILTEVGMRLQEATVFLGWRNKNKGGAEVKLRRVDMLLAEAEARMRDLAVVLDGMGALVCQADFQGAEEEADAAAAKQILRLKWEDVLPVACFQVVGYAPLQV